LSGVHGSACRMLGYPNIVKLLI